jgi:hypothetical protein
MSEIRTSEMKYFHIRSHFYDQHNGFTIAYEEDLNCIRYGVAYCSKKDHYEKAVGRIIAESKFKYYFLLNHQISDDSFKEVGEIVIQSEFRNPIHIKYHILLDLMFSPETKKAWVKQMIADELMYISIPKTDR